MARRGRDRHDSAAGRIVAALDIGSTTVGCLIARAERAAGDDSDPAAIRVIGVAQQRSRGVRGGIIVDLPDAQQAVRTAVAHAEAMAKIHVDDVHVAVNCGQPRSLTFSGYVDLADHVVRDRDIAVLEHGARGFPHREGETLLALNRIGYRLDDAAAIEDPRGLSGARLHAEHHAAMLAAGPLHTLLRLVEGCHLSVAGTVAAGHASALAATTEEERRLGVTCLDIGGDVTTIAGFAEGHLLFCSAVPVGGQHVTIDIARMLCAPLAQAERIKALYGTLAIAASDDHEHVSFQGGGEADARVQHTTKAVIGGIVRQRVHELIAQVGVQISACRVSRVVATRFVLTGGSCQLLGLADFVAGELDRPVRVGYPPALQGMSGGLASASFSCLIGTVLAALQPRARRFEPAPAAAIGQGYVGRMEQWLRDSF